MFSSQFPDNSFQPAIEAGNADHCSRPTQRGRGRKLLTRQGEVPSLLQSSWLTLKACTSGNLAEKIVGYGSGRGLRRSTALISRIAFSVRSPIRGSPPSTVAADATGVQPATTATPLRSGHMKAKRDVKAVERDVALYPREKFVDTLKLVEVRQARRSQTRRSYRSHEL